MSKIRIPRKKKKAHYWNMLSNIRDKCFPNVPKVERYYSYINLEWRNDCFGLQPEDYYRTYGGCVMDEIIWWHWVRKKHLGIEPKMSKEIQEYWDFFVEKGVIKS